MKVRMLTTNRQLTHQARNLAVMDGGTSDVRRSHDSPNQREKQRPQIEGGPLHVTILVMESLFPQRVNLGA
jgi:hypothetical protein